MRDRSAEANGLDARLQIEARGRGTREHEVRMRARLAEARKRVQQLADSLRRVDVPEGAEHRRAGGTLRGNVVRRPGRMRDAPHGASVATLADAILDEMRMHDQTGGEIEHLTAEGEVLGPHLPERRDAAVDHAKPEQPRSEAAVALERG